MYKVKSQAGTSVEDEEEQQCSRCEFQSKKLKTPLSMHQGKEADKSGLANKPNLDNIL